MSGLIVGSFRRRRESAPAFVCLVTLWLGLLLGGSFHGAHEGFGDAGGFPEADGAGIADELAADALEQVGDGVLEEDEVFEDDERILAVGQRLGEALGEFAEDPVGGTAGADDSNLNFGGSGPGRGGLVLAVGIHNFSSPLSYTTRGCVYNINNGIPRSGSYLINRSRGLFLSSFDPAPADTSCIWRGDSHGTSGFRIRRHPSP